MPQRRIVILGAGFAGLAAMHWLRRLPFRPRPAVQVVAQRPDAVYRPDMPLAAIAGPGFVARERIDIPRRCRELSMDFLQDTAVRIDPERQMIELMVHPPLSYDVLFWATGLDAAWSEVPGLSAAHLAICADYAAREASVQLLRLREGTLALVAGPLRDDPAARPHFATNKEPALYEVAMLAAARRRQDVRAGRLRIVLVTGAEAVGQGLGPRGRRLLAKRLSALGVRVLAAEEVLSVEPGSLQLATAGRLAADLAIWTPPTRGSELARRSGLDDGYGWVPTTAFMQHTRWPNIYAMGDAVARTQPKLGHAAMRQARVAAAHLWATEMGRPAQPEVPLVIGAWHAGGGVGLATITDVPFGGRMEYVYVGRIADWAKSAFGSAWRMGKGALPIMP